MSNSPWTDFPDRGSGPQNPYAATEFTTNLSMASSSDVETRNRYLNHEASVQGIGSLYLLGAILLLIAGVIVTSLSILGVVMGDADAIVSLVVGPIQLGFGCLQWWIGQGLRNLNPKVRTITIVFSVLGLLAIPLGTIISAYFLYLLASKKGEYVFSHEYAQVREATPEIRYRTSWIVWGFLIALILLIVLGFVAAVLSA